MPIHQQLLQHVKNRPDKVAFSIEHAHLTYKELWGRSVDWYRQFTALAHPTDHPVRLAANGKLIALCMGNSIHFPAPFVAATAYPHTCALIDPRLPLLQIEQILGQLNPDLVIVEPESEEIAAIAARLRLKVQSVPVTCPRQNISAEHMDEAAMTMQGNFLIGFTSGTTSMAKAYTRTRLSWRASLDTGRELFRLGSMPSTMCPASLANGLALYCLMETLDAGGTFHTVPGWDNHLVWQTLQRYQIERFVAVPTMISSLAALEIPQALDWVRLVVTGGAKLSIKHYKIMKTLFSHAYMQEYYGASELGFVAVSELSENNIHDSISRVGRSFPDVEITIRDSRGHALPVNTVGMIYVNSPLAADSYLWGDDGLAFCKNSLGATVADMGELDASGRLRVVGRSGGMVLTGGFNVYVSEVEEVLKSMDGIDEAIVIGVEDEHLGQKLVAVVCGNIATMTQLCEYARYYLPRHKIPRAAYKINTWPMTGSGKIKRMEIESMVLKENHHIVQLPA